MKDVFENKHHEICMAIWEAGCRKAIDDSLYFCDLDKVEGVTFTEWFDRAWHGCDWLDLTKRQFLETFKNELLYRFIAEKEKQGINTYDEKLDELLKPYKAE